GLGIADEAPAGYYDIAEPRETIPTALAIIALARGQARDAILFSANFGRDADTIGSIVGGIVGAFGGIDGLPADWLHAVNAANPVNQADLARRMYPCIASEIDSLRHRLSLLDILAE